MPPPQQSFFRCCSKIYSGRLLINVIFNLRRRSLFTFYLLLYYPHRQTFHPSRLNAAIFSAIIQRLKCRILSKSSRKISQLRSRHTQKGRLMRALYSSRTFVCVFSPSLECKSSLYHSHSSAKGLMRKQRQKQNTEGL